MDDPREPPPVVDQPVNPYADRLVDHREWQRLDPLMLLVHPIRELLRFLPVLLGLLIAGSRSDGNEWWWNVLAIGAPIALGVARYLTTSFRIAEGRVELRRGLLNKHVLSTPIDRVRTVDITASLIHRVLGLTTVRVGTGTASKLGEDELALDGVRAHAAEALRNDLLHRTASPEARASAAAPDNTRLVARFDPRWLWYAPFTTSGMVIAAAVLGAGSQVLDALGLWDHLELDAAAERAARLSLLVLVPVVVVALLVIASVLAVIGYLVTNFGFGVTYTRADHAWHLRRGLFTTRETSMDANRLRGVNVVEPLGLRLARGARLSAIVTGLNREQQGSSTLVPPAPQERRPARGHRGARHGRARRHPAGRSRARRRTPPLQPRARVAARPDGGSAHRRARRRRTSRLAVARARRRTRLGRARLRPRPRTRPRTAPESPGGEVGQPDAAPGDPRDPCRHRLDHHLDVVPAPRRPGHRRRHHGRRPPVGDRPRRARGDGYDDGPRRGAWPGFAVPRWSGCELASLGPTLRNGNPPVTQPG